MNDIIPADDNLLIPFDPASSQPQVNPLTVVHKHLRGRYRVALGLGVLLGIPLSILLYFAVPRVYTSRGIIRIAPTIQTIQYDTKDSQSPPYFESFVATQASVLGSRRVIDMALDPTGKLVQAGWPKESEGVALLIKSLEVSSPRGAELISATVRSKNPALAQVAVNAVLDAYTGVYEENGAISLNDRELALTKHQLELQNQLDVLHGQLSVFSQDFASDDVEDLHTAKLAEIIRLDNSIQAIDLSLAQRDSGSPVTAGPQLEDLSDFTLGQMDPAFQRVLDQQTAINTEMERMLKSHTREHREVRQLQERLDAVNAEVAEQRQKLIGLPRDGDPAHAAGGVMTVDQMKATRERYVRLREAVSTDAMKLEEAKHRLANVKDRITDVKQNLDDTTRTLEQTKFESRGLKLGRISIIQRGDLPVEPSTDRRLPLAIVGLLAGICLGSGIVLLFGAKQGGYRYIDELERSEANVPLLGTVPDLGDSNPDHESMAALSIHHLRNILQLQFDRNGGGKVFTVTSSAAGDGKTSLAIALAMSFAASGRRTLIIDTDLVGRGLTRQLELAGTPGLCDAVRQGRINGDIHATKVPSLWAMPAGVVQGFVPEHLSSNVMDRIIKELRTQYETIILDTGPILGSLEANVVAPASDGVVLVVSRGQSSKAVRASIQRLRRLGATCSGLIFNRAGAQDFDRSTSTASVSARSVHAKAQAARQADAGGRAALLKAIAGPGADHGSPGAS